MAENGSLLEAGTLVTGTYQVLHLIGRGGMGEVWLASHARLPGKQVAIKVLTMGAQAATPEMLARFRREAEIASRLGHPHIVQVLDFNTLPNGAPYLVLEYLVGESLATRLTRGPMSLEETQSIVRQVGSALHATHQQGVIHRDLKPDNVFLVQTATGEVAKVLDFGISKIQNSNTVQTQESALIGTPQYMAPEQALGLNSEISAQTDVFALGAMAYEMLSGKPAFSAENVARVVFKVAYEAPPALSQVMPNLSADAVRAIEHALEKEKSKRTPSVGEFVLEFTGKPLSVFNVKDVSGFVAPQSAATPSMMFGATTPQLNVPTPVLAATHPSGSAKEVKTVSGKKTVFVVLALIVAVGFAALLAMKYFVKVDNSTAERKPAAPVIAPVAIVPSEIDAGVTPSLPIAAEAEEPMNAEEVPSKSAATKERLSPSEKNFSAAEVEILSELKTKFAAERFQSVVDLSQRSFAKLESATALSQARGLSARAHCALKDLQSANAQFRQLKRAHVNEVRNFCKRRGVEVTR